MKAIMNIDSIVKECEQNRMEFLKQKSKPMSKIVKPASKPIFEA